MESQKIQSIDYLVLAGFQQRFQQVFECDKCAFVNVTDKAKVVERVFGRGVPLTYPYAFFEIKRISENHDSYNPHNLMRRGMVIGVGSNETYQQVRVIPANFDIDITYVTNQFQLLDQGSVMSFTRRWLLARRAGYLKSSVDYGRLQFGIGVTLDEAVATPTLDNITETESSFQVKVGATIHGYISEPILNEIGKINTFNVNTEVGLPTTKGQVVSTQFFAFPSSQEA